MVLYEVRPGRGINALENSPCNLCTLEHWEVVSTRDHGKFGNTFFYLPVVLAPSRLTASHI